MNRRFEKSQTYVEIQTVRVRGYDGLIVRSGRIGKPHDKHRSDDFSSARAFKTALDLQIATLRRRGFEEVRDDGFIGKLGRLDSLLGRAKVSPADAKKALSLLDELDVMAPKHRHRLAEEKVDLRQRRASVYERLGEAAFREQEPRYWARTDRSRLPNLAMPPYERAYSASIRAMNSPGASPKRGPAAPNYREAKARLERAVELAPGDADDARMMLAAIAVRTGDLSAAARWVAPLVSANSYAGRLLLATVRCLQKRWDDALAILTSMGSKGVLVRTNLAYIEEHRGHHAKALDLFRRVLDDHPKDGYAGFHSKRLEREGRSTDELASTIARRERRIRITSARDFYVKIGEIGDALRLLHDVEEPRRPLSESVIDKIRIAKLRNGTKSSTSLPESAKAILRYDRNFRLWGGYKPLLAPLLGNPRRVVPSQNIDRVVRREARVRGLNRLPRSIPVWNEDKSLPACIELAYPGDQRIFLYVTEPDRDGEFPIARFDDEPCVWITEASLIHLVIGTAIDEGVKIECTMPFDRQLAKAERSNRRHEERFSGHPRVAALLGKA